MRNAVRRGIHKARRRRRVLFCSLVEGENEGAGDDTRRGIAIVSLMYLYSPTCSSDQLSPMGLLTTSSLVNEQPPVGLSHTIPLERLQMRDGHTWATCKHQHLTLSVCPLQTGKEQSVHSDERKQNPDSGPDQVPKAPGWHASRNSPAHHSTPSFTPIYTTAHLPLYTHTPPSYSCSRPR